MDLNQQTGLSSAPLQLSESQERILSVIAEFTARNGYPPTCVEIKNLAKVSWTWLQVSLLRMEVAGVIRRERAKARSIVIVDPRYSRRQAVVDVSGKYVSLRGRGESLKITPAVEHLLAELGIVGDGSFSITVEAAPRKTHYQSPAPQPQEHAHAL